MMHEFLGFTNRVQAGRLLATKLTHFQNNPIALVLGLPRGGVPVGLEVARALHLPLDVFLVRKLGVPGQEEFAMGAIASNCDPIFQTQILSRLNLSQERIQEVVEREGFELARRENLFRMNKPPLNLKEKIIILVDDGVATGSTMLAALQAIKHQHPARLVVAVPVAAVDALQQLRPLADEIVCLNIPEPFHCVGFWYEDFQQTTDEEVLSCLEESTHWSPS